MSGEKLLPRPRKPLPGTLEERFAVEDDKRLFGFTGAGSVFGAFFAAWALTMVPVIPKALITWSDPENPDRDTVVFIINPPKEYRPTKPKPNLAKVHPKPGQAGTQKPKPKTAHPSDKTGWLGQNILTARGDRLDVNAYDLIGKAMKNLDLDKTSELPVLKKTPHSGIGGRRGPQSFEFNEAYFEDGDGKGGDGTGVYLPGDPPAEIPTHVKHADGPSNLKSAIIDRSETDNARSTASILAVIRSRSPGLRHIYNNFLKQNPGFAGKITLRFEIAPGGDVVSLEIASSTTHVRDFDAEILRQVKSWRFDPVKAIGNDHVTVPFNFSE